MGLGERIKLVRGRVSQKDFSETCGVGISTLRRYESGVNPPDTDFLCAVTDNYDVNPLWMLTGEGDMYRRSSSKSDRLHEPSEVIAKTPVREPYDTMGLTEGIGLLVKIYTSEDRTYIRAINANLLAFADAVESKFEAAAMKESVHRLQSEISRTQDKFEEKFNELKQEVLALRNENSELKRVLRAKDGNDCEVATG